MATKKPKKEKPELNVPVIPEKTIEQLRSEDAEARALALTDILGETLPAIPHSFRYRLDDAERVRNAFDFTFMLMGGQPRFALWAAQNPGEFYKLYSRLLPAANNILQTNGPLTIITNVPDSPLDNKRPPVIDVDSDPFDDVHDKEF